MARLGEGLYQCQTPDGYKNTEDSWLSPDATTLRIGFATALGRGNLPVKNPPPPEQPAAAPMAGQPMQQQPQLVSDQPGQPKPDQPKPVPLDPTPIEALLGPTLSDNAKTAVAEAPDNLKAALILGGPDFMRR
jgi:hypothetical protein